MATQRPPHKQVCVCVPLASALISLLYLWNYSERCSFELTKCVTHICMCVAQVVLSKFVRQMGDLLPPTLYIPYLRMLRGLASGPQCSHYCFSLLKSNGPPHGKVHSVHERFWILIRAPEGFARYKFIYLLVCLTATLYVNSRTVAVNVPELAKIFIFSPWTIKCHPKTINNNKA